ncbi:MAG TPA: Holliday junction resolvase RuvX [bacterium]|nr:Holliday junction resolvase RuvX [bacterium]
MRLLALDYGSKYIGVALSDELQISCRALPAIVNLSRPKQLDTIRELCATHEVEAIVIGIPLSLDKTEGPQAKLTKKFAGQVSRKTGLATILWDETHTSQAAEELLTLGKSKNRKDKARLNSAAAQIILSSYLNR